MGNKKGKSNLFALIFGLTSVILAILLIINVRHDKVSSYNSSSILARIDNIKELATVKYNYTGVISYKDYLKFMNLNLPLTEKYFIIKYSGYLKAGVDFSRVKVDIINEVVHVSIPKAKILDTVIDEKSIQVFNESDNAFNPIKIDDYNKALSTEKSTMQREAIKQGLLKDATDQAKLAITSLLKGMGFENIVITEEIEIPQIH
ncbi:MAG: DUF4230 domain-containing protein [Dysgonamonadaceae bacterium]|nr:DUF4230 domain-containing protein [Dysgonamonadaceae bacterium]MDD3309997.1 DUF4230 domain-containing protein [Dysgonamonadaceae bacterium]MDD3900435.1 DUF4230 domain-containing protein [Dysgonamonadaceae bacterium]MDD4399701.1 DUF4230 domain-containing protein [Dysgonamonadaceae bacterium]MEA5080003.1 DUF4230 domain-containing protein [Dysgonamonadaceae bacterium]